MSGPNDTQLELSATWSFDKVNEHVYILKNNRRLLCSKTYTEQGPVKEATTGKTKSEVRFLLHGASRSIGFQRSQFDHTANDFSQQFQGISTSGEFITVLCQNTNAVAKGRRQGQKRQSNQSVEDSFCSLNSTHVDQIHEDKIKASRVGTYLVDIMNLKTPPRHLRAREVNVPWVNSVKRSLIAMPGTLQTILPVVPENEAEFKPENIDRTIFYTLGGNHQRRAAQDAIRECKNQPEKIDGYQQVRVELYLNLEDPDKLLLSNLHNARSKTLATSFMDKARQARSLLYVKSGLDMDKDEPPSIEDEPKGFRAEYARQVAPLEFNEDMNHSSKYGTEFFVARMERRTYERLWNLHEERVLGTVKEPVIGIKDVKKLQGLDRPALRFLLDKVDGIHCSFKAITREADLLKRLPALKQYAARINRCKWEYLKGAYPEKLATEKLYPFAEKFPILQSGKLDDDWRPKTTRFDEYCDCLTEDGDELQTPRKLILPDLKLRLDVQGKQIKGSELRAIKLHILQYLNAERQGESVFSDQDLENTPESRPRPPLHSVSTPRGRLNYAQDISLNASIIPLAESTASINNRGPCVGTEEGF